jgi:proteasome lid subunit RPN8/RPN11
MNTAKRRLTQDPERVNPVRPVHIWRSPPGSAVDMLIVTHLEAYSVMHEHATAALPNETGGFLIGRVSFDHRDGCWHIEIEEAVPVAPDSQDPVHFTFTWRDVDRVRSYREGQGKALVGWFHTHPDLGIFLSETDLERTHRVLFTEPFQVALVYDPTRGRAGYFFWEAAQMIDASQAAWREFDIAVMPDADEAPREPVAPSLPPAGHEPPPAPADGQAAPSTVATAAVPGDPDSPTRQPAQAEAAGASSGTQFRRLRAIPAEPEPAPTATPDAATPLPTSLTPAPGAGPHHPPPHSARGPALAPRHIVWFLVLLIVVVALCGAVGYFWLNSVRGAQ